MKIALNDLEKAIQFLKTKTIGETVQVEELSGTLKIVGTDRQSRAVTLHLYDSESNKSFATVTRTERL